MGAYLDQLQINILDLQFIIFIPSLFSYKPRRCLSLPESFSTDANLTDLIADTASLTQAFAAGNITASQTVDIIDAYVSAVYASSGDSVSLNPYGCDVNGLATLAGCEQVSRGSKKLLQGDSGDGVVRAVTLAGAFVPAKWATGGKVLSMEDVKQMYAARDFEEMAALGVNTVQIPVPTSMFSVDGEAVETLNHLMNHINKVGLKVILLLVDEDNDDNDKEQEITKQIEAAATYATSNNPTVIALQIPSPLPSIIGIVRTISPTLPILLPLNKGQISTLSFPPDKYLYASLDESSTSSVSDVASSDSLGDRMKMFYHESLVCIDRSPIEYMQCYKNMPVYVSTGFDLAIDDCVNVHDENFKDYGQCDRFDETMGSDWWERHRKSLVERKLYTYSMGAGFSFSGWKLYNGDDSDSSGGIIDSPAKLLCLRDVAAAGLLTSLKPDVAAASCLNGPKADFVLGDATLAPSIGPHDCGSGWWNATTHKCDYWIPPPPTPFPTEKPTVPCPSCEEKGTAVLAQSAAAGAVVALVLNWAVKKMFGSRRDGGYETLP
jgi:hypothetical protein